MITNEKKLPIIISIVALILLVVINIPRFWAPEKQNAQVYTEALSAYNNSEFQKASLLFGKVSTSSKLKSAATYRQALCADKTGDEKTAINKYKELIRRYPNSKMSMRAKYLKAQAFYKSKKMKKAKKEFKKITKQYPNSDYAIASDYYLGSIEAENIPKIKNKKKKARSINKASHYFRAYLKEAPTGRFAINSIDKWTTINRRLTNEDNLIIAKSYQANEDYVHAQKYLNLSNIAISWPYFVKNAYATKNYSKVKYYTELGLKNRATDTVAINDENDTEVENKNIYDAIDTYLRISDSPKNSILYLLSFAHKSSGYEYLLYKSCNNIPAGAQIACYNTLYTKYPDGNFAADALSNIFYSKIQSKDYYIADELGKKHLRNYKNAKSTPRVMFWLAKLSEKMKNYEGARGYYKSLISRFPDDYYAYHAFLNLHRQSPPVIDTTDLEGKEVLFPYKRNADTDLIIKLTEVRDYGLINELCKDDEFVQSWLAYQEGNFGTSARLARDAMDKLQPKPSRKDLRWRLVYPVHYYDEITEYARPLNNSPIIILSIIREESYFNPKVRSAVGACGLMQIMPSTAKEVGARYGINFSSDKFLLEPDINIKLGNAYYSQLRRALLNRDVLAVLAYNGGIGSVTRWKENLNYTDVDDFVEQVPYEETQNYLKKVYKSYWNYVRIYAED